MENRDILQELDKLKKDIGRIRDYLENAILIVDRDPASSVNNVGKAVERILKEIYTIETNEQAKSNSTIYDMLSLIPNNAIRKDIKFEIEYIQRYRNLTAHDNEADITAEVAEKCINSFSFIFKWYKNKYDVNHDIVNKNKSGGETEEEETQTGKNTSKTSKKLFLDAPARVRMEVEKGFIELGKEAFGDSNFDLIKWFPAITVGIMFILPGGLFGPIGLGLASVIGFVGYLSLDKLMGNEFFAEYINKPKHALSLISQGEYEKAIIVYDKMFEHAQKAKAHIDKLDKIPGKIKKIIIDQIGKELSAKDFYVYESAVLYAQGLLHEAQGNIRQAKEKYSKAGISYSGNNLALDRIEYLS